MLCACTVNPGRASTVLTLNTIEMGIVENVLQALV